MSKKQQSDADILAKLQEMLGGRGVKDVSFGPEGGDGSEGGNGPAGGNGSEGGSGGNDPAPDNTPSGGEAAVAQSQAAPAETVREEGDESVEEAESEARDSDFVAFLQRCENELNAIVS